MVCNCDWPISSPMIMQCVFSFLEYLLFFCCSPVARLSGCSRGSFHLFLSILFFFAWFVVVFYLFPIAFLRFEVSNLISCCHFLLVLVVVTFLHSALLHLQIIIWQPPCFNFLLKHIECIPLPLFPLFRRYRRKCQSPTSVDLFFFFFSLLSMAIVSAHCARK